MGAILLERQSLFGGGSSNSTIPSPAATPTFDSSSGSTNNNSVWKYVAIVIVITVIGTLALSRVLLVRRSRLRKEAALNPSGGGSFPSPNGSLPPYYAQDEYARRRKQNREVRQALRDAGLLLSDEPRQPTEVERADQDRIARRERRERRRQRRREEEEGAGLPAYSKEKGEGEEVLERGMKSKDDSGDSSGESDEDEDCEIRQIRTPLISVPRVPPPVAVRERHR